MASFTRRSYLLVTRDPVHVGAGGYRLGRVDNSIVREAGTYVPKIPGTSLHGAIRAYAARIYENPEAAGQSHEKVRDPATNPICYTFGYIAKRRGDEDDEERSEAKSGVANIFDARVLLFPVHTARGPMWVTTAERLAEAGCGCDPAPGNDNTRVTSANAGNQLNLGWLNLSVAGECTIEWPANAWQGSDLDAVKARIAVVGQELFSQVVNSNLEVRTSVSINSDTGAAQDGALFTYEALPRATFLTMDVVIDDYRESFPKDKCLKTYKEHEMPTGVNWTEALDVMESGLKLVRWLGVGGMGTRGFGRLATVGDPQEDGFGA